MRILITGTPGVGKTTLAALLAKKLKYRAVSEKEFCEREKIGEWNPSLGEREVPLDELQTKLSEYLLHNDNVIVDGHLSCECKLRPIDIVFVIRLSPDVLEIRLSKRQGYFEVKIQDNVMCEGIDYCLKHATRNYGAKTVEIRNDKGLKETMALIMKSLHRSNSP